MQGASFHELPDPHADFHPGSNVDSQGKRGFANKAKGWKPGNVNLEQPACTVSRYAQRLIDRSTGKAYSADEISELLGFSYDPAITGLTGGGSTKLDGINVGVSDVGRVQLVVIDEFLYFYTLTDGENVEDYPMIVVPDNGAATHWLLRTMVVRSAVFVDEGGNIATIRAEGLGDDVEILLPTTDGTMPVVASYATLAAANAAEAAIGVCFWDTTLKKLRVTTATS